MAVGVRLQPPPYVEGLVSRVIIQDYSATLRLQATFLSILLLKSDLLMKADGG